MSGQFNTSNYNTINEEICAMLSTGKYASIAVNMYTNPECTDIALDSQGNQIINKTIANLTTTDAHKDINDNPVNATATITFSDNTTLVADDENDLYWYVLVGTPLQLTKF